MTDFMVRVIGLLSISGDKNLVDWNNDPFCNIAPGLWCSKASAGWILSKFARLIPMNKRAKFLKDLR